MSDMRRLIPAARVKNFLKRGRDWKSSKNNIMCFVLTAPVHAINITPNGKNELVSVRYMKADHECRPF